MDFKQLTYCPLDLPLPETLREKIADEISLIPQEHWFWSSFRTCWMLGVFAPAGHHQRELMSSAQALTWTEPAMALPHLRGYLEAEVWPLLEPLGRVVILRTDQKSEIAAHVDCTLSEFDDLQHKIRIVVRGARDTLYFVGDGGKEVWIDGSHPIYMLDGSHPHGMRNHGDTLKYTICLGWPWQGAGVPYQQLLFRSFQKFRSSAIERASLGRPFDPRWFQDQFKPAPLCGFESSTSQ